MINLKDYTDTIRTAVAAENEKDENWKWSVKSVGKTKARIGWGYLDYIDNGSSFSITAEGEKGSIIDNTITMRDTDGGMMDYIVVGGPLKDTDDPADAIRRAIRWIGTKAHSVY